MPVLTPPSENSGSFGDTGLWRLYTFPVGIAIVRRGAVWALERAVVIDGADEYYLGGCSSPITAEKAAELTTAGFGAYIGYSAIEFGGGPYGSGEYGS